MFAWCFDLCPSLLLLNYSKIELKTRKEMKWFGELVKDHQSSKNPALKPDFFSPWQAVRVQQRRIDKRTRQGKTATA